MSKHTQEYRNFFVSCSSLLLSSLIFQLHHSKRICFTSSHLSSSSSSSFSPNKLLPHPTHTDTFVSPFCWCIRFKDPSAAALVNVWPTRITESCTSLHPELVRFCVCLSLCLMSGPKFVAVVAQKQTRQASGLASLHNVTELPSYSGEVLLICLLLIPICVRPVCLPPGCRPNRRSSLLAAGNQRGQTDARRDWLSRDLGGVDLCFCCCLNEEEREQGEEVWRSLIWSRKKLASALVILLLLQLPGEWNSCSLLKPRCHPQENPLHGYSLRSPLTTQQS